jgi:hypothetical protein
MLQPTQVSVIKSHQSSAYPKYGSTEQPPYSVTYIQDAAPQHPTTTLVPFDGFITAADGGGGSFATAEEVTDGGSSALFAPPLLQLYHQPAAPFSDSG